ncbi:MAG TPA: ATP-binding protein [Bacillales bacterium]|nr:ATP-binding protein [Bacillales bacterium]
MSDDREKDRRKLKVVAFDPNKKKLAESTKPKETCADVGGLEEVKEKIRMNFIMPLKHPEIFQAYGREAGGSLLLYGPPGCGKTFLAKAIAGEIEANFLHLELQAILSMWVGESEHNLHDIFEMAREQKPCVLFIDELDSIGGSRNGMHQHHDRMLVNQLLLELDGMQSFNEDVYVIGATNTPWYLDPALRRPGRFNQLIFVSPPAEKEREVILKLKAEGKPHELTNLKKAASNTAHFSGADLEQVMRDTAELALQRSLKSGQIQPMTNDDLNQALKGRRATTLEWFSTAKNYATFSDVNNDYQPVLDYIKEHRIR